MIPLIQPPGFPVQQGWSPNSLRPTAAQISPAVPSGGTQASPPTVIFPGSGVGQSSINFSNWGQGDNTAGSTIVPSSVALAAGGGTLIPVLFHVRVIKTIASGGPSANARIRWAGVATDLCTAVNTDLANARNFIAFGAQAMGGLSFVSANPPASVNSNLALQVSASVAGPFGGSDATMLASCTFYIWLQGA